MPPTKNTTILANLTAYVQGYIDAAVAFQNEAWDPKVLPATEVGDTVDIAQRLQAKYPPAGGAATATDKVRFRVGVSVRVRVKVRVRSGTPRIYRPLRWFIDERWLPGRDKSTPYVGDHRDSAPSASTF